MKKVLYWAALLLFAGIFAFSGWKIWTILSDYRAGEQEYEQLGELVSMPELPQVSAPDGEAELPEDYYPTVNFDALAELNPDVMGWIYLRGTHISYPIVQGADNEHYVRHLFTGKWNNSGTIFLDADNSRDLSDAHSIIYGHHMKNGTMFSDLSDYKKPGFIDEHPYAMLMTPAGDYRLEFFAGYVCDVEQDAWKKQFAPGEFEQWLQTSRERSCFVSPIVPTAEDRVVTLSTCDYDFQGARFVLLGVLRPVEAETTAGMTPAE